jgi:hypothetical protein
MIDADLGGGLIKQRVARPGQGRSSGYRVIVAYLRKERAVFLYGFSKNERGNIGSDELTELRQLGLNWLLTPPHKFAEAIAAGVLQEIDRGEQGDT